MAPGQCSQIKRRKIQNSQNFSTPTLMTFLNLKLAYRVHLHFKCLDTSYPEANSLLGAILSILMRLEDNRIYLALIYILLKSIRDKKFQKHWANACSNVFLFRYAILKQCFYIRNTGLTKSNTKIWFNWFNYCFPWAQHVNLSNAGV